MKPSQMRKLLGSTLFALLIVTAAHAGPVDVSSTVTNEGMLFRYEYAVTSNLPPATGQLLSVTLSVPADATAVQDLTAPTGYSAFFDAGLGLVDFVENTSGFDFGLTVSPFSFLSPFRLTGTGFTALALNPSGGLDTFQGQLNNIPEPAPLTILASGLIFLAGLSRLKRRRA